MNSVAALTDLVQLANSNTGILVAFLWIAGLAGIRQLKQGIRNNADDLDGLVEDHQKVQNDLTRVDQKQDHIVQRQETMLERLGMNENEIQQLREETARLDESQSNPGGD